MLLRRHKNQENKPEAVAENAAASSLPNEKTVEPKKKKSKSNQEQ